MCVSSQCDEDGFFPFRNLTTVVRLSHTTLAEGLNVKMAVTVGHTLPVFDFNGTALQGFVVGHHV